MLTPQYLLPPPEPYDYCYEWETGYGIVRKFSATPHHGMPPTRAVALYTADQMRAALAAVPAQPVAWLGGDGHPHHISAVQTITERRIYGSWQPLYAAPQAVPVPAGMALAPVNATAAMNQAADRVRLGDRESGEITLSWDEYEAIYRAMLAAAAPKEQP